MKKILIVSTLLIFSCPFAGVHASATESGETIMHLHLPTVQELLHSYSFVQEDEVVYDEDSEVNSSADEDDAVTRWIGKIFLWIIYSILAIMALAATGWSFTGKGFWAWTVCLVAAFCYAMLLGRYWGYGLCLIIFAAAFSIAKLAIQFTRRKKTDR